MPRKQDDYTDPELYQRGRIWWYNYRIEGDRFRKSTGTDDRELAGRIARSAHDKEIRKRFGVLADDMLTLEQAARKVIDRKVVRAKTTRRNHQNFAGRAFKFFGPDRTLGDIQREDVEQWRNWLVKQPVDYSRPSLRSGRKSKKRNDYVPQNPVSTLSTKTVNDHISWLSHIFNDLEIKNPCARVERLRETDEERQKKIRYWKPEQVVKVQRESHNIVGRTHGDLEFKKVFFADMLQLLLYTGCRIDEVESLRFEDYIEEEGIVWVVGKGRKRRSVPVAKLVAKSSDQTESAKDALESMIYLSRQWYQDFKKREPKPTDKIVFQYPGWFYKELKKCVGRAEVPWIGQHGLRHTFVTWALKSIRIELIAYMVGHSSISQTYSTYGHLIPHQIDSFGYGSAIEGGSETQEQ